MSSPSKRIRPALGVSAPRHHTEDGGLARAVRPDHPGDAARLDCEGAAVHRGQAAEAAGQAFERENRGRRAAGFGLRGGGHDEANGSLPASMGPPRKIFGNDNARVPPWDYNGRDEPVRRAARGIALNDESNLHAVRESGAHGGATPDSAPGGTARAELLLPSRDLHADLAFFANGSASVSIQSFPPTTPRRRCCRATVCASGSNATPPRPPG